MKTKAITEAKDSDLRSSTAALNRAARLARETAIRTGTNLVVVKDGRLARIPPQVLRPTGAHGTRKSA